MMHEVQQNQLLENFFDPVEMATKRVETVEAQIVQDAKNGHTPSPDTAVHLLKQQIAWELAFRETEERLQLLKNLENGVFSAEEARFLLRRIKVYKKQYLIGQKNENARAAKELGDDFFSETDTAAVADEFFALQGVGDQELAGADTAESIAKPSKLTDTANSMLDEIVVKKESLLWLVNYLELTFFKLTSSIEPEKIVHESMLEAFLKEKDLFSQLFQKKYNTIIVQSDINLLLKSISVNQAIVFSEVTRTIDLKDASRHISTHFCEEGVQFVAGRVLDFDYDGQKYRIIEGRHIDNEGNNLTNGLECFIYSVDGNEVESLKSD